MRLYDTGVDGYQERGLLISREIEGNYGGCVAKMLDEIRCHFEFNNLTSSDPGEIDIYVSPNNKRELYDPEVEDAGWIHVMHLDSESRETRFEQVNSLNCFNG